MNIIEEPENRLESLLRLAATEPAHRPEFYKLLLQSPLFVLGEAEEAVDDGEKVPEGSNLALLHWEKSDGTTVIPVFTSMQALHDSIDEDESYLEIPARALFKMTLGEELMLNPDSEYGKQLMPAEVESLLSGSVGQQTLERVLEESTEVVIGQPEQYPGQLVDSLTTLFSKHTNVKAAYLGLIHVAEQDDKANLIIGLQGEGDLQVVIQEAGAVAWDITAEEEVVDFIIVEQGDEGIAEYFLNETKPFYDSRWGSKMEPYTEPGKA
jgi:hypothetical protein